MWGNAFNTTSTGAAFQGSVTVTYVMQTAPPVHIHRWRPVGKVLELGLDRRPTGRILLGGVCGCGDQGVLRELETQPDPCATLELPMGRPTRDVLSRAHRRLAKRHHPDVGGDPATFRRIQAAYELLCAWLEHTPEEPAP